MLKEYKLQDGTLLAHKHESVMNAPRLYIKFTEDGFKYIGNDYLDSEDLESVSDWFAQQVAEGCDVIFATTDPEIAALKMGAIQ